MEEKTIAISGNPNTGKTTIFNTLTGLRQEIGNWPGVTVEKKEGYFIYKNIKFNVVDLPGTYTLTEESEDQKIAIDFLTNEKVDTVILTANASNLERSLYLLILLSELNQNIIVVLNMIDIAEKEGIKYDIEKLEKIFGIPFVETIANKGYGIENLKEKIYEKTRDKREKHFFKINYGEEIESYVSKIEEKLKNISLPYPSKFISLRLLEKDERIRELIKNKVNINEIDEIIGQLEKKIPNIEVILIEKRYGIINGMVKECLLSRKKVEKRIEITNYLDRVLTNNFLGPLIFLLIMFIIFQIVFKWGAPFQELLDKFFHFSGEKISLFLHSINAPLFLISFIEEGIISGIGSVVMFLPNIFLFFLLFAILEETGYMARAAFTTDRLMHKMGLHGKSAIPLILGFGCNVPAIMSTRTLETKKDKILTILVIPFMSCSARLPVYILFTGIFFKSHQSLVIFSIYLIGILLGILMARIFKFIFFKEESIPIIIELPPYEIPYWKNVIIEGWERTKVFLKRAGTIIFVGVLILWFLSYFPDPSNFGKETSLIGRIGNFFAPILKPAGFGFWQASVALIFGIYAKELVVGCFGTLFGENNLSTILPYYFTPASSYSFMLMTLLYIPCLATIAIIKREIGIKWALFSAIFSIFLGYLISTLFYQLTLLF